MSNIFSRTQAHSAPALTGVGLQTSVAGRCIPVVYGTVRVAPNLVYYADFKTTPHQQGGKSGAIGGAAGKGGAGTTNTYSATVILAVCEGPVQGFGQAWASKTPTTPAAIGLTAFLGAYPQASWGYVVAVHPADARPYTGVAYLAAAPYDFGNSGQIPNNNVEVYGFFSRRTVYETGTVPGSGARTITVGQRQWDDDTFHSLWVADLGLVADSNGVPFVRVSGAPASGQYQVAASGGVYTFSAADAGRVITIAYTGDGQDADPSLIAADVLSNPHYGVGFPQSRIGELTAVSEVHAIPAATAGGVPSQAAQPVPIDQTVPIVVRNPTTPLDAPVLRGRPDLVIYPLPDPPVLVRGNRVPGTSQGRGGHVWAGGGQRPPTVINKINTEQGYQSASPAILTSASYPGGYVPVPNPNIAPGPSAAIAVSINSPGTFQDNLSVADASSGALFTCVAANPGALQYAFNGGNYFFNAADSGKSVLISYVSLAGLVTYQNYCWAAGIFLSPQYDNQQQASAVLDELASLTNSEVVASAGSVKVVPRGDTVITGSGHTYTPPTTLFDLTDDHFKDQAGATDPVIVTRKRQSDQNNVVQLQYRDRSNSYNPEQVEATDQAMVDAYGRKVSGQQQAHPIAVASIARFVGQLMLQEQSIRKGYAFSLPSVFGWLDPMDLVTITDTAVESGAQKAVRIIELQEAADGSWDVTAEDYLAGVAHAPAFLANVGSGFAANYEADPGSINVPVIYEPPAQISSTGSLEAWIYFSGANALFGGGEVWVASEDALGNIGDYQPLGRRDGQSRMGVLATALPTSPDPDTTHSTNVDLSESAGIINPGTTRDADQGHTLCLIDAELISYSTASLVGPSLYQLRDYIRRGMYGTAIASHGISAPFTRLDDTGFVYPYDKSQVGRRIHIKVRAYNTYGGGLQDLSGCVDYPYTIIGPPQPTVVTGFVAQQVGLNIVFSWTDLPTGSVKGYDIYYGAIGDPLGIANATLLTEASRTTETTTGQIPQGSWTVYIAARNIADQLGPATTLNVTVNAFQQTFDLTGSWLAPAGITPTSMAHIELWGGGGGGAGFGGGGGGGGYNDLWIPVSQLGSFQGVTVGLGGTAGALNGDGGDGGTSAFGGLLGIAIFAFGGGGGGATVGQEAGGGGGGITGPGQHAQTPNGGSGGGPLGGAGGINSTGPPAQPGYSGGGGADNGSSVPGGAAIAGGGGGGCGSNAQGGSSVNGGGGGAGSGTTSALGGASVFAGNGGNYGKPGDAPAGGGGSNTSKGFLGAAGRVRVTVMP